MVREIVTEWTVFGGGTKLSIMYFDEAGEVSVQREALDTLWTAVSAELVTECEWTIRTDGRELNTATGTLEGFWGDPIVYTGTGAETGNVVADSTQALIQWLTTTIVDGRRVRGRTFIPGLNANSVDDGDLASAAQSVLQTAAQNFLGVNTFVIWSRPGATGSGGVMAPVQNASVWSELAVQRSRRG